MRLLSACVIALLLSLSATNGFSGAAEPENRAVQLTEQSLDSRASLEYVDTPLSQVLKDQAEIFGVKIELAAARPGEKAIDPKTPVNCNLKAISLRSALRILLDQEGLDFVVRPDGVISVVPASAELKAKHVESKLQAKTHAKLREVLREETTLDFVNTPLNDVIAFMSDQHDCTICFSGAARKRIALDEPTTASLRKITLHEALKRMLLPRDLRVIVQNEVLLIVPWEDRADAKPSPEVAMGLAKKFDTDLAQPLRVIAHHFTEQTGVRFALHYPVLKAAAIDLKRDYTVQAHDVTAADALARIKPALPLKLIEREGLVLISVAKDK